MNLTIAKRTAVCLTTLALAACGGGGGGSPNPTGTGGTNDGTGGTNDGTGGTGGGSGGAEDGTGGADGGSGGNEGDGPSVSVEAAAKAPGLASTATASVDEEEATISWSITGQPDGSTLEDDDLIDADGATVTFHPQLRGEYELTVTATVSGKSTTRSVSLDIEGYDVPYSILSVVPGDGDETATHLALMVNSGGGQPRPVGCSHVVLAEDVGEAGDRDVRPYHVATYLPRAVGEPARIASRVFSDDEDSQGKVEIADSSNDCDGSEPTLVEVGLPVEGAHFPLRFSPNGTRLLTATDMTLHQAIVTVGAASGDLRALVTGTPSFAPHHGWASQNEVLVQNREAEDGPYSLWRMEDMASAEDDAVKILDCTGVENSLLPVGQIEMAGESVLLSSDGMVYRLDPDEEGHYDCERGSEQNHLVAEWAMHFDVSDDGTRIAYYQPLEEAIYVASVTTPGEPTRISPADGMSHRYPRFALGGQQVVWTGEYDAESGGMGGAPPFEQNVIRVYRANADGSYPFVLMESGAPEEDTLLATTGNSNGTLGGCSFAGPLGAGSSGFLLVILGAAAADRRRRLRASPANA